MNLNSSCHWCLSGGAPGADLAWGDCATRHGHGVIHFSFARHQTNASYESLVRLTEEQLATADPHCEIASQGLRRRFPARSAYVTNLLRRNWFQVAEARSCYAISSFSNLTIRSTIPLGTVLDRMQVKGGTAWAVAMFIRRHGGDRCPCYVFDQEKCHWFQWQGDGWECLYHPPAPVGVWAGIGTRHLNGTGKLAIRILLEGQNQERTGASDPRPHVRPCPETSAATERQ